MRARGLVALAVLVGGCAFLPTRPAVRLLSLGDALMDQGEYVSAVAAYDELLTKYPDDPAAASALSRRDAVAKLTSAQREITRLRADLSTREIEVTRLRQEIDRLRADLEHIKQTDLKLERKR